MVAIPPFTDLDSKSRLAIQELAIDWRDSCIRPQLSADELPHWDDVIEQWVTQSAMPLLIRKKGSRGELLYHDTSRPLVIVDNSPANWCYACALLRRRPTLLEIQTALQNHKLPVAMIFKGKERPNATYLGILGQTGDIPNLNSLGWEVCHINNVGLNNAYSDEFDHPFRFNLIIDSDSI